MLVYLMRSFINSLSTIKKYSEHTVRNYAIDINSLRIFICLKNKIDPNMHPPISERDIGIFNSLNANQEINIDCFDSTVIKQFIADMYKYGKSRRTIVRRIASIRTFSKFLVEEEVIKENIVRDIEIPKANNNIPIAAEQSDINIFFDQPILSRYLGFRDRCIMEVLYGTGIRVSELSKMNKSDIDFEARKIKIKGKGKVERIVPANSASIEWIKAYLSHFQRKKNTKYHSAEKDPDAVFLNCFGNRITPRSVDRMFSFYFLKSGLSKQITPHTLRRSLACYYLEMGVNIKDIKNILGHKSIASTSIYAKATSALRESEYFRAHPRA